MKNGKRIIGIILYLMLYISSITPLPFSKNPTDQITQDKIQKKQIQASISAQDPIFFAIDVVKDYAQNNHLTALKKYIDDRVSFEKAIVSKENSKFKQYSAIWCNQLITSRKTDQLFPQHTFG